MSNLTYRKNRKFYLLLIVPALLFYCFALVGPLFFGTVPFSFLDWNLMTGKKSFAGVSNYIKLFSDAGFRTAFLFTLKVGICTIIGSNVLGFMIAYFLNERVHAKGVIRAMFFIPNIISSVLVAFVWMFIFTWVLPSFAKLMGWSALENLSWFGTPGMATLAIIIVSIWQSVGFLMLIYTAGLQTISTDITEAAAIDGCTGLRKIFKIQLPLLMPTITINLFVSISATFKSFDIPYALTSGGPYGTTQPVALNIYHDAFVKYNMGYGSAKSVVLFLTVALITLLQLHITRKKEVEY